jgi:hypothetical protein
MFWKRAWLDVLVGAALDPSSGLAMLRWPDTTTSAEAGPERTNAAAAAIRAFAFRNPPV